MKALKSAGIDAVILFPFTGPATQKAWTLAAVDEGLEVLIGAHMTHEAFLSSDNGYIDANATTRIYEMAVASGVRHFVVPGNKPDVIRQVRDIVSAESDDAIFYARWIYRRGADLRSGPRCWFTLACHCW